MAPRIETRTRQRTCQQQGCSEILGRDHEVDINRQLIGPIGVSRQPTAERVTHILLGNHLEQGPHFRDQVRNSPHACIVRCGNAPCQPETCSEFATKVRGTKGRVTVYVY